MNPPGHVFFGLLFSAFLFFLFPEVGIVNLSLLFLSSTLMDVDHYFFYIYRKKSFDIYKAYKYALEHKRQIREFGIEADEEFPKYFYIFHGFEIILIAFILSFFFKPAYFIFIGFSFHLLLDLVEQAVYSDKFQKVSALNDFLKSRE